MRRHRKPYIKPYGQSASDEQNRAVGKIGTEYNAHLASQCTYYPRFVWMPSVHASVFACRGCTFEHPKSSCPHSHLLVITRVDCCEGCLKVGKEVRRVANHSLCPQCLSEIIALKRRRT